MLFLASLLTWATGAATTVATTLTLAPVVGNTVVAATASLGSTVGSIAGAGVGVMGASGCGKSSTINAMFDTEVAKVGRRCDPETMEVSSMELNELLRF